MNTEIEKDVVKSQENSVENAAFEGPDVVLTDDEGERIATMREYVFLNLASSGN
jgi:hypothetical protein